MLEHRANLDGELLAALATGLQADASRLALDLVNLAANDATVRADDAVRPDDRFEIFERFGFVVEIGLRENGHGLTPLPCRFTALSCVCKVYIRPFFGSR